MATPGSVTVDCSDDMLLVSWRGLTRAEHDRAVTAVRAISGAVYDAEEKLWRVPVRQADRLYEALPDASYDYDAICAVVDAQERRIAIFGQNLLDMGVKLVVVDGRVIAQGNNVSSLVQSLIDERCDDLRVWLQSQNARKGAWRRQIGAIDGAVASSIENAPTSVSSPSNEDLQRAELLATSMRNAAQHQYHQNAMRQRNRRRKVTA